jgi:RNA-binding protein 26
MGSMGGMGGMGMPVMNGMGQMNNRRPQVYQPPDQKRGICRDYHSTFFKPTYGSLHLMSPSSDSGYCARGVMCKYSHGEDAVVPGQLYPMNAAMSGVGMPFMPMFPGGGIPFGMGGGAGAAYDPHEARMDMRPIGGRPQQRAPLLPRIQQEDGSQVIHSARASGELPVIQDLTPNVPVDAEKFDSQPQPPTEQSLPDAQQYPQLEGYERAGYGPRQNGGMNGRPYMPMNMPMDVEANLTIDMGMAKTQHSHGPRPGVRGGGRSRGGTFGGESHNFRPERRNDKTLVVEKIPEDKMTLEHVNGWFKRFGTVTNVAIDSSNAKALISFANHDEAYAAWKSEDAVFNNRFVKLFWHRPMEGHGQAGARMLAASAPLVANISIPETPVRPVALSAGSSGPSRKQSATVSSLAAKHQQLEQQIAEQKSLMDSLSTATAEEKKTIMARLRKLGEEMKPAPVDAIPSSSTGVSSSKPTNPVTRADDHERKEKERLDKELEMHNATGAVDGEDAEDLKAKLERLKAEVPSHYQRILSLTVRRRQAWVSQKLRLSQVTVAPITRIVVEAEALVPITVERCAVGLYHVPA